MSEQLGTFMNVLTDFGFKRMFGTERFKHILIRFLNVLFASEGMRVTRVEFHDKEVLPPTPDGKRIVYDVYCTTPEDREHFILEMQQEHHTYFEERMMYYISKGLSEQGKSGSDYSFSPVYGIVFVDFQFKHLTKRLVHDFRMRDMESGEVFSNILRLLIVTLTEVKETWEECDTELERIVFLIKNMHKMNKESAAYKSKEYEDMFNASEIGNFAAEDVVAYKQSVRAYEDRALYWDSGYNDGYDKGVAKGKAEGIAKGRAEGIAKGRAEGIAKGRAEGIAEGKAEGEELGRKAERIATVRKLIAAGMDADFIKGITGIDPYDM